MHQGKNAAGLWTLQINDPPNGLSGTGTATGSAGLTTTTVALNNPNFGRILSAYDPRIMQIAMKFVF